MTETKQDALQREENRTHRLALVVPEVLRNRMHESGKRPGSIDMGAHETEIIRKALKSRQIIDGMRNQLQQEGEKATIVIGSQQLTDERLKAQLYDLQKGHKSRFVVALPIPEWEELKEKANALGSRSIHRYIFESIALHLAISEAAVEEGQKYHARLSIGGKEIEII